MPPQPDQSLDWNRIVRWLIAPAIAFSTLGLDRGYLTDFWNHLARGRDIVRTGQVISQDRFTYTAAGQFTPDMAWITNVLFYRLFELGGLPLVQTIHAGAIALLFALLVRLCMSGKPPALCSAGEPTHDGSASLEASAIIATVAFLGTWQLLIIRPQTLSLLLFVLLYSLLTQATSLRRQLALLIVTPILFALWANLHAAFAMGLGLIGVFTLAALIAWVRSAAPARHEALQNIAMLTAAIALGLAGACLNPYGWRLWLCMGTTAGAASSRHVEEWIPPTLANLTGLIFWASVVAVPLLYWTAQRRPTIREICMMVCFLPPACRSTRMIVWWMLAMAPVFACLLSEVMARKASVSMARRAPAWPLAAAVAALCLASVPSLSRFSPLFVGLRSDHRLEDDLTTISQAVQTVAPNGRIFTRMEWGEYFDWTLGSNSRVFIDGRCELYSDAIWKEYCAITSASPGWEKRLDDRKIDVLVLDPTYEPRLMAAVAKAGQWRRLDSPVSAAVYVRQPPTSTVQPVENSGFTILSGYRADILPANLRIAR